MVFLEDGGTSIGGFKQRRQDLVNCQLLRPLYKGSRAHACCHVKPSVERLPKESHKHQIHTVHSATFRRGPCANADSPKP